jgi:hypothetical protein
VNVAEGPEEIVGEEVVVPPPELPDDGATVSTKAWTAFGATPLLAVMVKLNAPATVGVPESTHELDRLTPAGNAPDSAHAGVGVPVATIR